MTYRSLIALSSAALLAATPVFAETLTPSQQATKQQLATHIGVNADDYTLEELSRLSCQLEGAHTEADRQRLLEQAAYPPVDTTGRGDANQLAAELGVSASDYTLDELVLLKSLIEGEDCNVGDPLRYVKGTERLTNESAEAKRQLARSLGVQPQAYTLRELVRMQSERNQDN